MLTYSFDHIGKMPLYEYLYRCIRKDIEAGRLQVGEKLPSKRALARQLGISTITVEGAYGQLTAEGYCRSLPKRGFYVTEAARVIQREAAQGARAGEQAALAREAEPPQEDEAPAYFVDFAEGGVNAENFPFTAWTKLLRQVVAEEADALIDRSPGFGAFPLRQAIAAHLAHFRGLVVRPEQIVIGAGTEYLYSLLVQFFGRDKRFCVENPGYGRIRKIYESCGACCLRADLDEAGVWPAELCAEQAQILHISPSHHFPTGIIMPISRRYELLGWAAAAPDRYIIEDDYDSEFRLTGRPIPTLMGIDVEGRVIYMNTFSKSLTPTIRISYLVLPEALVGPFTRRLGFYSCTVSNFEQYTLARFIESGAFEKHINRMRTLYRKRREKLLSLLRRSRFARNMEIVEHGSGLHFLVRFHRAGSDASVVSRLAAQGIHMRSLSSYYAASSPEEREKASDMQHLFVLDYSSVEESRMPEAVRRIERLWERP